MIELIKHYKITVTERQLEQLWCLLQNTKDAGELGLVGRYDELRELYNELDQHHGG